MIEQRAAVRERLVDQEADRLRKLKLGRDQILARLWELATLSHEVTRGIIAGQIKALSMIIAIEGLIPDICSPDRLREQQHEPASEEPGDPVAAAPQVPNPEPTAGPAPKTADGSWFPNLDPIPTSPLNPFIKPEALNRVPAATGFAFDAVLDRANPIRLSFSPNGRFSGRRR